MINSFNSVGSIDTGMSGPSQFFSDVKCFMNVVHQSYFTMAQDMPYYELLDIYRTLK